MADLSTKSQPSSMEEASKGGYDKAWQTMTMAMAEKTLTDSVARVPFKTVLVSVLSLWVAYYVIVSLRAEFIGLEFGGEMLWLRLIASAVGAFITLGLWLVLRPLDGYAQWVKVTAALVFAFPAAMLIAQANWLLFADMQSKMEEKLLREFVANQETQDPLETATTKEITSDLSEVFQLSGLEQVTDLAFSRYFMLLAWCALYLALLAGQKAREAERREGDYRRAAKAAELRSLRYQVNPHFLFNTFNSLSAMVLTGKVDRAETMIQLISNFYRKSLAEDPTCDVPLREEIALQQLYLEIESVRFPERLRTKFDIPDELASVLIPGMILQPLVENSVKHGVAPNCGQVTITLSAREDYGRLVVTVSDDGAGGDCDNDVRPGFGIGLSNVRERLAARFGDEASLVSGRAPEGGYATHLRIPMNKDQGC